MPVDWSGQSTQPALDLISVLDAFANHTASLAPVQSLRAHVRQEVIRVPLYKETFGFLPVSSNSLLTTSKS